MFYREGSASNDRLGRLILREQSQIADHLGTALLSEGFGLPSSGGQGLTSTVHDLGRLLCDRSASEAQQIVAKLLEKAPSPTTGERSLEESGRPLILLFRSIFRCTEALLSPSEVVLLFDLLGTSLLSFARIQALRVRRSDEKFAEEFALPALLEHIDEAAVVIDQSGRQIAVSAQARRLFTESELERAMLAQKSLATGRSVGPLTVRVRVPDSEDERLLIAQAWPIFDDSSDERPNGLKVCGALQLWLDHTELSLRDKALERDQRTLGAIRERLFHRSRDRAFGELAAGTALAINNELNAGSLGLSLLRMSIDKSPLASARHLDTIENALKKSATLTAHLQELATSQEHGVTAPTELNTIVTEALDLVRPELTAAASEHSLRVDATFSEVPLVTAERTRLRELICTLLISAREELRDRGILMLHTEAAPQGAVVTISYPERIPPAPEDEMSDRALLLASAADSLRRWGGRLLETTERGQAYYRLELARAAAEARPVSAPTAGRKAERILIVDDEETNRESLREILELSGFATSAAADGDTALRLIEHEPFSVALVDLAMPGLNGWELAERMRRDHPQLRIAFVTGWESDALTQSHPSLVDAVFRKPIEIGELRTFLEGASSGAPRPG